MKTLLAILAAGPSMTLQDAGRPGHLAQGLSIGGAVDPLALAEAAALLGAPRVNGPGNAAIEMAGIGGGFAVTGSPVVFALTGAPMRAKLDGAPLAWNATHLLEPGQRLDIGPATRGSYGYLSFAGGIAQTPFMGSRSAHLAAGIGAPLVAGDSLSLDPGPAQAGLTLDIADRFSGGEIAVLPGPQSDMFAPADRDRFAATSFTRAPRGNRMGVEVVQNGAPFTTQAGLSIVSEVIVPGDIQMTGAGMPFVLGPECQTTGGYPRLATVIPSDLPRALQAAPGATLRFRFVTRAAGLAAWRADIAARKALTPRPLLRDPHDISDLLAYQLISGVTDGGDPT